MTESRSVSREAGGVPRRLLATTSLGVLAMLTTALTVFERGLFQDDAHVLLRTFVAPGGTVQALTLPITSATRRLQGGPYAIALASGEPLLALRVASEGLTPAIGLLAALLAFYALRLPAAAAFAAGALTLTASSDWLTASFVAIGYNLAITLYLAGALALVRWSQTGRAAWLVRLPDDLRPSGPASAKAAAVYAPARHVRASEASWIARSLLQPRRHVITRP